MSDPADKIERIILPIPDRQHVGLTTYDAKDPDTKFPAINWVRIDLEKDDQDHLISPEERFKIAMARQ